MTTLSDNDSGSASEGLFDRPSLWRLAAARELGLRDGELVAALSPGAAFPAVLRTVAAAIAGAAEIVDLGAGMGGASAWIAERTGARVTAVEPADGARRAARELFDGFDVVAGTADDSTLPDGCADAVLALGVVSLLADLDPLCREARRLLRGAGSLAIADLCAVDRSFTEGPNTFRSLDDLAAVVQHHGFGVVEIGCGQPEPDPRWAELAAEVDRIVARDHSRDAGYAAWVRDQERLDERIRSGALIGGCVVGRLLHTPAAAPGIG